MQRIPAIVFTVFFLTANQARAADTDPALLEWARNAPLAVETAPAKPAPATKSNSALPLQPEPKPLFVERNPESQPRTTSNHPAGIAGIARSAENSVTFTGSLIGRACKSFARTTRATIDGKPQYMRADERTARYNNNYVPGALERPYSDLQTGAKTVHDVLP
jgi:hypothetical protein